MYSLEAVHRKLMPYASIIKNEFDTELDVLLMRFQILQAKKDSVKNFREIQSVDPLVIHYAILDLAFVVEESPILNKIIQHFPL